MPTTFLKRFSARGATVSPPRLKRTMAKAQTRAASKAQDWPKSVLSIFTIAFGRERVLSFATVAPPVRAN